MQTRSLAILFAGSLAACVGDIGGSAGSSDNDAGADDDPVAMCEPARPYMGFGGTSLTADRPTIAAYSDRVRLKPFGVLASEYNRALGLTNFDTSAYAATFGNPPARWYQEPQATANTIYAAFALAYDGCLQKTASGTDFATAPSAALADRLCRDFALAAWRREPSAEEVTACTTFAINKTNPADTTRRRWAYTCAAVLTASSFLAY